MGTAGSGGTGDIEVFLADLARWTADSRASEAAGARVRERWLRQQAVEDARFAGMLVDLAEQGAGVSVRTTGGRTLQGRIATVAGDFCVVRHDGGMATLVSFRAVATVRPEPGHRSGEADSARLPLPALDLAEVLARLAPERPRVRIIVEGGGEALAGELRSVGVDIATIRLDGDPPGTVYLQLDSVREVTLLD
ncbi:MAG TPA: hypothetical protein VM142_13850 [Acidimicrobiales bacterium]|nr:hypothetical protein [Acidimicrobiales bacterium]